MSAENQAAGTLVDTVIDRRYRVERLLGEGGMGAVYLATDLRLDRRVAIKVMARELTANPDALARFHREARVTSALGHPHIVQVFDFSTTPAGEPFLVMEFLDGEDLDCRLRRVGRLPVTEVVHIVKQAASALSATHDKTIVHRDLKPANIYLLEVAGERDFVKVLDFGISKVRSAPTTLTRTASVVGTPNYMSPEQANGRIEDIDERTDQWALACIAWKCLSGETPFVAENVPSLLFHIVHEPPPSLLPEVAGLPQQVEAVLLHALAKDKNDRYPSVSDFAEALESAATGAPLVGVPRVGQTALLTSTIADVASARAAFPLSTFTHRAGGMGPEDKTSRTGSKTWIWVVVLCITVLFIATVYLLFRPGLPTFPVATPPRAPTVVKQPPAEVPTANPPPSSPAPVPAETPPLPEPAPMEVTSPPLSAKPRLRHRARRPSVAPPEAAKVPVPATKPRPSTEDQGGAKW